MEMEDTRLFEKYLIINIDNIQRKYAIRSRYGSNKNLTTGPDLQNIIKSDNDKGVPNDTPCTPISILQLKFRVDRILVLSILFFFFLLYSLTWCFFFVIFNSYLFIILFTYLFIFFFLLFCFLFLRIHQYTSRISIACKCVFCADVWVYVILNFPAFFSAQMSLTPTLAYYFFFFFFSFLILFLRWLDSQPETDGCSHASPVANPFTLREKRKTGGI